MVGQCPSPTRNASVVDHSDESEQTKVSQEYYHEALAKLSEGSLVVISFALNGIVDLIFCDGGRSIPVKPNFILPPFMKIVRGSDDGFPFSGKIPYTKP